MDLRFQYLGLSVKSTLVNSSEGIDHRAQNMVDADDNELRLDPQACNHQVLSMSRTSSIPNMSASSKGTKRKWFPMGPGSKSLTGSGSPMGLDEGSGIVLGFGRPASSSDSRGSSGTSCTGGSLKDTDQESSVDLGLGIHLQLGNVKSSVPKKYSPDTIPKPLDMDSGFLFRLSLSRGITESDKSCVFSESDCMLGLGQKQNEW